MNLSDRNFKDFKAFLVSEDLEEAKNVLVSKQDLLSSETSRLQTPNHKALSRDKFASCLIPNDIVQARDQSVVPLKATANGNCLYNAVSIMLCGSEILSKVLRLLVAGELFLNATYYADHPLFHETLGTNASLPFDTLFAISLTEAGDKKLSETCSKTEAVKAEALAALTNGNWSSLIHLMGLPSVISRPVNSVYPDVNLRLPIRNLMHRVINPRVMSSRHSSLQEPIMVLWSRDGNFDNRPGVCFEPNHFVPLLSISKTESTNASSVNFSPDKTDETKTQPTRKVQQGTLFAFMKKERVTSESSTKSSPKANPPLKRKSTSSIGDAPPQLKKPSKQKFVFKWKDEFPWLKLQEDDTFICSLCISAANFSKNAQNQFVTGCQSTKKETMQKHASSSCHLRAQAAFLAKQRPVSEGAIAQSLARGTEGQAKRDRKDVEMKINTAYFLAKEELSFSKFEGLINLQRKNGVDITTTYANHKSCSEMVSVLGRMFKTRTAQEIQQAKYISVMADGATDAGGIENETVFCRYVRVGRPINRMIGHKAVQHAHAEGL